MRARARVVLVENVRRSGSPSSERPATDQHTNARIKLDVLDVLGAVSELGGIVAQGRRAWALQINQVEPDS
jgi:hypothetical protein